MAEQTPGGATESGKERREPNQQDRGQADPGRPQQGSDPGGGGGKGAPHSRSRMDQDDFDIGDRGDA